MLQDFSIKLRVMKRTIPHRTCELSEIGLSKDNGTSSYFRLMQKNIHTCIGDPHSGHFSETVGPVCVLKIGIIVPFLASFSIILLSG